MTPEQQEIIERIRTRIKAQPASTLPPESSGGRYLDVASNAAKEAVAGFADMFGNAPSNVLNLGRAAVGREAVRAGRPDLAPDITPAPNIMRERFQKQGWITPQAEPKTTGERYLSAGTQGATAGAPYGIPGMVLGAASNLIGQGVTDVTDSKVAGIIASLLTAPTASAARSAGLKRVALANQLKQQKEPLTNIKSEANVEGMVFPPGMENPILLNRMLESLGGKQALQQDASIRNQEVVNALVRKNLRMQRSEPITEQALETLASQRAQPYRDVAALPPTPPTQTGTWYGPGKQTPQMSKPGPQPEKLLEQLRAERLDAKLYWRSFNRSGDVDAYKKYQVATKEAQRLETAIEQAAVAAGKADLVPQLRAARTDIAKIHDVSRALNPERGEVSAIDLAKAREKGVPLTGELELAARAATAFPKAFQDPAMVGTPGAHALGPLVGGGLGGGMGAILGGGGGATLGSMAGALSTPYIQAMIRNLLLSAPYQAWKGTPNYSASLLSRGAAALPTKADPALLRSYILAQELKEQGQ